jgi:membrane associated rhomboid family serine protease
VVHFAFIPAAYLAEGWPVWSLLAAPFTYALLHGGLGHLALNGVMLAVMGQVLERRLGPGRFLLLVQYSRHKPTIQHRTTRVVNAYYFQFFNA